VTQALQFRLTLRHQKKSRRGSENIRSRLVTLLLQGAWALASMAKADAGKGLPARGPS